jgi:imidazolonepropionase-like amidohydrolase
MACLAMPAAAQDVLAITGGTVIGAGPTPLADAVVVVEGGRITRVGPRGPTAVPPNATVIDAAGKFVMPGLSDMHNHALSGSTRTPQDVRTNLRVLLAYGVTTVFNPSLSTADLSDLRAFAAPDPTPSPRFLGTGPMISIKGDVMAAAAGSPTPDSPDAARAAVRTLKAAGVDAIKVMRDDFRWARKGSVPLMRDDVLAAVVDEGHREGLKVFAHAPLLDQAKEVLRAGGDGLLHGIVDRPVDQEFVDLMRRNRAVYVPTLSLYEDVADVAAFARRQSAHDAGGPVAPLAETFPEPPFVGLFQAMFDNTAYTRERLAVPRGNLRRVVDAGIPVVMGTDSGFYGILMGVSSQLELALMVEAGMTPDAAVRAATIEAARMLGREKDGGSVEPGKLADLLILDASPLEDIRNVRRIHRVIRGGVVHDPAEVLSSFRITRRPAPAPRP